MNAEFRNRQLTNANPLANIFVVVVGAIAIAVSFVIGVFALVVLAAVVIVLAAVLGIRIWWFGVKAKKGAGQHRTTGRAEPLGSARADSKTVIEGEFQIIQGEKDANKSSQT